MVFASFAFTGLDWYVSQPQGVCERSQVLQGNAMSERNKKCEKNEGVQERRYHYSAGTRWNLFCEFYVRRFHIVCAVLLGIYCVAYLILALPLIGGDLRPPGRVMFQVCLIVAGPVGGGMLFCALKLFYECASKRTGLFPGRPFLLASTEVPKVRIGNPIALLNAGFAGLIPNSKGHRESMKRALRGPYLYTLSVYDEFEERFDRQDWEGALAALQRIFNPTVFPFARSILFEAYGDALGDYLVLTEVKSWFCKWSPGMQLRMAVVSFILEDYRNCVIKLRTICRSDDCVPETKKIYIKMMDLILAVAAFKDANWQRVRVDFWKQFPEFGANEMAQVVPSRSRPGTTPETSGL
jgi:hypothetical protein